MKYSNRFFLGACTVLALSSCADQGLLPYPGDLEIPDELILNKNLDEYDVLKNYVNRSENPNFKLGCAINESDFINKGSSYSLALSNFDDVTPGNAMKYSSVVDDNGGMDFSTVMSFIETAKNAGISVYGHTLCWHSQQNVTYLNSLVEGKKTLSTMTAVSRASETNKYCLKLTGRELKDGATQQTQAYYTFSTPLAAGTYTLKCRLKSTADFSGGNLIFQSSSTWENQEAAWGALSATTEWTDFTKNIEIKNDNYHSRLFFQFNLNPEDYLLVDDISLTVSGSSTNLIANPDFESGDINGWASYNDNHSIYELTAEDTGGEQIIYTELLQNGDFENGELSSCYLVQSGGTTYEFVDEGGDHGKVLAVTNPTVQTNSYDSQFIFSLPSTAQTGEVYVFSVDVKSLDNAEIETQAQSAPGQYLHWQMFGNISSSSSWTTFTKEITIGTEAAGWEGLGAVALNLGKYATTYYFDNISFQKKEIKNPGLTDEEKREVVYAALDNWIKNMMNACGGYVKVWDVVNEPMSDGSPFELKHYENQSADTRDNCFYWQDYLGDNYARDAIALARKYFAEYGGNPEDLILFINDYNLEASYNSNKKCEGLIKMIQQWESDGITKIDGIGTQMHVSYSMNPSSQQKNEECVVNMLQLLANTGKLVKISELDMGITDENGDKILTNDVTYVQLLYMADYYNFIVRKYFEIIPAAQRYGITQWSTLDAGDLDYSWRKGEPIGLWTRSYERKPAYAGFADGLTGTEKSYLGWADQEDTSGDDESIEDAE